MNRFLSAALTLAALSVCSNSEAATTAEERARIWAVAKLVLRPGSDEALATIRAGILDSSAAVRAASARVSRTTRATGAIADLREALSRERDPDAGRQIVAALADLDDTVGSDDALVASLSSDETGMRLYWLVAARGRRLSVLWPRVKATLEEHSWMVARGLKAGLHQSLATLFASYALRDGMEDLYDALLFSPGLIIEPGVVTSGLASPLSGIRSSAYIAAADRALPMKEEPPKFERGTLCERTSRHLLEAARGFTRTEPLPSLMAALAIDAKARKCVLSRYSDAQNSVRGLAPKEREVLLKEVGADKGRVDRAVKETFEAGVVLPSVGKAPAPLRTLSDHYSPDLFQAVLEGTKCKGRERSFDGVDIVYAEGGRIQSVLGLKSGSSAEGCSDAAKVLGLTSYVTEGYERVTKILPERPEFLACLGEPDPPSRQTAARPEGAGDRGPVPVCQHE